MEEYLSWIAVHRVKMCNLHGLKQSDVWIVYWLYRSLTDQKNCVANNLNNILRHKINTLCYYICVFEIVRHVHIPFPLPKDEAMVTSTTGQKVNGKPQSFRQCSLLCQHRNYHIKNNESKMKLIIFHMNQFLLWGDTRINFILIK